MDGGAHVVAGARGRSAMVMQMESQTEVEAAGMLIKRGTGRRKTGGRRATGSTTGGRARPAEPADNREGSQAQDSLPKGPAAAVIGHLLRD